MASLKRVRFSSGERREWDALPTDIMIQIFNRMSDVDLLMWISSVCRSWRSAVMDTLFSCMGVLDLRRMDNLFPFLGRIYLCLLKIFLDSRRPNNQILKIHFTCKIRLKKEAIFYIAQRTPFVQYVDTGKCDQRSYIMALRYWKNLKGLTCWFSFLFNQLIFFQIAYQLRVHCKGTSYLSLFGRIRGYEASAIVKNLPNLKQLTLKFSSVTIEALLILDGHKKLEKLNLRHTIFVDESKILTVFHGASGSTTRISRSFGEGAKDWTEDIRGKVAGNKVYLRCKGRVCPKCSWAYQLKSRAVR